MGHLPRQFGEASIGKRLNIHPVHMDCWLANCSGHSPEQFPGSSSLRTPRPRCHLWTGRFGDYAHDSFHAV